VAVGKYHMYVLTMTASFNKALELSVYNWMTNIGEFGGQSGTIGGQSSNIGLHLGL